MAFIHWKAPGSVAAGRAEQKAFARDAGRDSGESVPQWIGWGRAYFALQSLAGALWWAAVAVSPTVRTATLGNLDPALVAVFDIPLFVVGSAAAAAGGRAAAAVVAAWSTIVTIALGAYATVTMQAGTGVLIMAAAAAGSTAALCLACWGRIPVEWIIRGPFAFRPARQRDARFHVAATFGQIIIFWGFFLGLLPLFLDFLERRWGLAADFPQAAGAAGLVILVLASALGIWSAISMSTVGKGTPLPAAMATTLVVAGPYRWIRNPMAVAGVVQGAAVGFMLHSWFVVGYAVLGSLVWNYAVRPLEEADLKARFGSAFEAYREAVPCWLPSFRRV
ncbi:methyltransferase family protein [Pseudarthrobacter chlorophenolicus]|uniref:methyltransferase family protein n=1 Tax=Pseudarthrobacter chlorophenolicus TaxID=85085 RepID=UPI00088C4519|nr:isoprenylcysteine carboxylmethyltransferase family protein [Pseudarthrobacter chlorophenolicus]SDQ49213.1 Phospholipid methyltransferase [Pseudarthrobacter chlorophenolicus]